MVPLAPLPLGWALVASFFPAGAKAIFFCPLSGSGAVAESSPICTNRLFETGQLRRKRHGSARRLAQLDETKPVFTGRTKRPIKGGFLLYRARHVFFCQDKRKCGAHSGHRSGAPPAPVSALMPFEKKRSPTLVKHEHRSRRAAPEHPGSGIGRTQMPAPEHPAQLPAAPRPAGLGAGALEKTHIPRTGLRRGVEISIITRIADMQDKIYRQGSPGQQPEKHRRAPSPGTSWW